MSVDVASLISASGGNDTVETTLRDHELTHEEWEHANPSLALSLLSDDEVNALVPVAQSATAGGEKHPTDTLVLKWMLVAASNDLGESREVGVLVVGIIRWASNHFALKTFVNLKTNPLGEQLKSWSRWASGPLLVGETYHGAHVGPIQVNLPSVGLMNFWAREKSDGFHVTADVRLVLTDYRKRILIGKRPQSD
ncbi:hypothetical protein ONZ45_g16106 [Pleurotus djamor]|nr:hypothetical protein ONZ45_g16106 [Pleurotus djamor]